MKKTAQIIAVMCILGSLLVTVAYGASKGLKKSSNMTKVDGVIQKGEYSYNFSFSDYELFLNWNGDKVYIGVTAETEGWIGVGINSSKMNESHIHIGFVDRGRVVFKEQSGVGKAHKDTNVTYVKAFEMKEDSGNTTMELEYDQNDIIKPGQKNLEMIMAYGKKDTLTQYHGNTKRGIKIDILD
jgi:hypothetical protein